MTTPGRVLFNTALPEGFGEAWLGAFAAGLADDAAHYGCPLYGGDTALWMRRWRWFFLATAGLFGYADGSEWGVSHFRMKAG